MTASRNVCGKFTFSSLDSISRINTENRPTGTFPNSEKEKKT